MTDELKPLRCPFCGSEPTEQAIPPHVHMQFGKFRMPDCLGSHVVECGCGAGFVDETREKAIAAWNARAPSVPEGWRLVPVVATEAMEQALAESIDNDDPYALAWTAAIDAAPKVPT